MTLQYYVTPHAGVWIETTGKLSERLYLQSLPMRECGLKQLLHVWTIVRESHSPCGSVD